MAAPRTKIEELLKTIAPNKNVSKRLDDYLSFVQSVNRSMEVELAKHAVFLDLKSALYAERMCLELLVEDVERELRIEKMPDNFRKDFKAAVQKYEKMFPPRKPLSEICIWGAINKPDPRADCIDREIFDKEYDKLMRSRDDWLSEIKMRCVNDPVFARLFFKKLMDSQYPMGRALELVPKSDSSTT